MKYELTKGRALVITGDQGSGKSTMARKIAENYGSFKIAEGFELNFSFGFSNYLEGEPDALIIEGLLGGRGVEAIWKMLSSDSMVCNLKGRPSFLVKTPYIIVCLDDNSVLPMIQDDRRFKIIHIEELNKEF
jgi:hypothetical protein